MSRLPPIPAASQPAYGPGAVPKNFTYDPVHFEAPEPDLIRGHLHRDVGDDPKHFFAGDDLGGAVQTRKGGNSSEALALLVFGAVVATIVWLAGKKRR